MMKKLLLIFILAVCGLPTLLAQGHHGKKDEMFREIQEFKMKYLAQEMDLKENQTEQFFKIYEEMSRKRFACMKSAWKLEKEVKKNPDATESEYQKAAEAMCRAKEECAAIETDYNDKFSKFLSQKQIFKMKSAEEEFRKKMEEMRRNRKGKR